MPMADVGPIKVPDSVTDEQALFLSDIFPTGYMAAENAQIQDGDTVAIWGCGPVGQFAIRSALMMGAGRVIAIDEVPERLAMAEAGGAETIDFSKVDVYDELMARTNNRGPDSCIDAVGCEASGHGAADAVLDKVKAVAMLATDRVHVLREAIFSCRKGGTISIPGVYVGMGDKIPIGAAMNKGLTFKMGQTHVQAYTKPLLEKIEAGAIDPSFVVTTQPRSRMLPRCTRNFVTRRMGSSRWFCARAAERSAFPQEPTSTKSHSCTPKKASLRTGGWSAWPPCTRWPPQRELTQRSAARILSSPLPIAEPRDPCSSAAWASNTDLDEDRRLRIAANVPSR